MPEKLDRCVKKLRAQGYSQSKAYAICKAAMKKNKKK